jgi:hypothetical protein
MKNIEIDVLQLFEVAELEERLENRWCTTTIEDKETHEVEYRTERCTEHPNA